MKELEKVRKYIEQHNMIEKGDSVIVGLSGGADSVCLYKMLLELRTNGKFDIYAVHIHHGIRGSEADRDLDFVKKMCENDGTEFLSYKYNVPQYAKENGLSEEEAGRILRYATFRSVIAEKCNGRGKIAVAHNMNDSAETFIHNLCRGSGIKGLTGISPAGDDIIRPVLCLTREEIESYLNGKNIDFVTDSTNMSEEYTRNKIRHNVLPFLQNNINDNAMGHICEAAGELDEAESYLVDVTRAMYEETVCEHNNCIYIDKKKLLNMNGYLGKRVVRMAVLNMAKRLKDISRQHIADIIELADKQTGRKIMLPYGMEAQSLYGDIVLKKICEKQKTDNKNATDVVGSGTYKLDDNIFQVQILDVEKDKINIKIFEKTLKLEQKECTKCFDYDKINFTVQLRFYESGDYLVINAAGNTKKLKSFFVDKKIPAADRGKIPLIADGSHIMWIVGHRISEDYKITSDTKRILKITRKDKEKNAGQD